jgi:glycosyltransferase involved in cell wall biosynthesis
MNIVYITAGAAGMYCGSCMRDNTLAAALRQLGHDCLLLPTYTPIRTDEADVSSGNIFFGGISVYLEQKYPWLRRMPGPLYKMLSQPWLLRWVSRYAIKTEAAELAALTLSMLRGMNGFQRQEVKRLTEWLSEHTKPDAIVLTNALLSGMIPELGHKLGVPVVITLQGDDIFLESLSAEARQECIRLIQRNCQSVAGYLTTCRYYADFMSSYLGLPRQQMHTVYPGINLEGFARPPLSPPSQGGEQSGTGEMLTIGFLARICPEKGLQNLVTAFNLLQKRPGLPPSRLRVAGYLGEHRKAFLEEQKQRAVQAGWGDRFEHVGEPDHAGKIAFLQSLDIFSVPTDYHDPKGLYVLEAMACGVPVVQPAHGSFPELIDATGGGLLVQPNSPEALADGLAQLLLDADQRQRLGGQGAAAIRRQFTARHMAEGVAEMLQGLRAVGWATPTELTVGVAHPTIP